MGLFGIWRIAYEDVHTKIMSDLDTILSTFFARYSNKNTSIINLAPTENIYFIYLYRVLHSCVVKIRTWLLCPYSPTILQNILCPIFHNCLYLDACECNMTSDWLNHMANWLAKPYRLANQKSCYIPIVNLGDKDKSRVRFDSSGSRWSRDRRYKSHGQKMHRE